jgi:hypothetical protein
MVGLGGAMDNQSNGGHAQFDRLWKPVVGFGVLLAFGLQPILPLISPVTVLIFVISAGVFYNMSYERFTSSGRPKEKSTGVALCFGFIALGCLLVGTGQFLTTMQELSTPCRKLRRQIIVTSGSEASDRYNALRCPVFFDYPQSWRTMWLG